MKESTPSPLGNVITIDDEHLKERGLTGVRLIISDACLGLAVSIRRSFQLPTSFGPTTAPNPMSVSRDRPRHMTVLPGGGSLARAR